MSTKQLDASSLAQKAAGKWAHMTWDQQERIQSILCIDDTCTAASVMIAIRKLKNDLVKLEKIDAIMIENPSTINSDDLLAFYVGHESKFSTNQKHIMAAIVDDTFTNRDNFVDAVIARAITKADNQSLIRLERTMRQCFEMYVPMQLYPTVPPFGPMYTASPPPPQQGPGLVFK